MTRKTKTNLTVLAIFAIAASFSIKACRSQKPAVIPVPVETQTIIRERLVEVAIAADSALMTAYFECDSNLNVLIKRFDERKSANMTTSSSLDAGRFTYQIVRVSDTIYVSARDSVVYKEIPFAVNVPFEVNRITGFQHFQIWAGRILLAAAIAMIFLKLKFIRR